MIEQQKVESLLRSKCEQCCGLCCSALYFAKLDGFPYNKKAKEPCRNLTPDFRCVCHKELKALGYKGCLGYDCSGAGNLTYEHLFHGTIQAHQMEQMYQVYLKVCSLQQMLAYLWQAYVRIADPHIESLIHTLCTLYEQPASKLLAFDTLSFQSKVNQQLKKVWQEIKKEYSTKANRNTVYAGKSFQHQRIEGKDFSGCLLIACDLEAAILHDCCFIGADLRDANIKNADLSTALYLTQQQVNSAIGNQNTKLPKGFLHPSHWN